MLNLTQLEQRALDATINLSDGHPRQDLTESQLKLVYRLPEFFETAHTQPFIDVERRAQTAFLSALGQAHAPVADGRVFSVYSSSVATMAVAGVLRGHRVALIHPTFDNIHDILARTLCVMPVSERHCADADLTQALAAGATCLFITTPNNPTGWVLDRSALERLATACATKGLLLCLDVSFRGFDPRAQFDHYSILERSGVQYLVIEDTGKLWPMQELKLGFLAASGNLHPAVEHVLSDVLLTVSPFILTLVEMLSLDAADGGLAQLHHLINENRQFVSAAVDELEGVELVDPDARASVCQLRFPSAADTDATCNELREQGVHVLPCRQFYWARPHEGSDMLRLALARNSHTLAAGLGRLSAVYQARRADRPTQRSARSEG
jgi:enduracididine biosynthesis enzyme MppP